MVNKKKDKLKVVPQYIKNVSKSTRFVAKDLIQTLLPNTYEFTSTNADIFKAVSNDIRNHKTIIKRTQSMVNSASLTKDIKEIKKNFIEDLKSGNLYNTKRIEGMEGSMFGDLGLDSADFNFDGFDMGELDFDNVDSSLTMGEKVQSKASMMAANAISNNTAASMNGFETLGNITATSSLNVAQAITENQNSINTINMINTQNMFSQVNSVLTDIANNLRNVSAYTENLTTYFNQATKDNETLVNRLENLEAYQKEFIEMQRNLYKEYNKNNEFQYIQDKNSYAENGFNVADYFSSIKKNAKSEWNSSIVGSMLGMMKSMNEMGGSSGGMLDDVKASPGKYLIQTVLKGMIGKQTKKSFKNFDEVLQSFMSSGMLKMSSTLKQKGRTNQFYQYLYKIFGLDLEGSAKISTDKYTKGPMPYNGYANKALTDVIPTYLRKILAAITNQGEMYYNYKTGKFNNETEIKKSFKSEENMTYSSTSFDEYKIKNKLSGIKFKNKSDNELLDKKVSELFKLMISNGFFYDPNDVSPQKLKDLGLEIDDNQFKFINTAFKSMSKKELMDMNNNIISGINRHKSGINDLSKTLTENGYSGLVNGANKNTPLDSNGKPMSILKGVDEYNKSIFDYLRDIRSVLVAGIKVFQVDGWKRKKRNMSSPDFNNAESLFERYKNEIKMHTQSSNDTTQSKTEEQLKEEAKNNNQVYMSSLNGKFDEKEMIKKMNSTGFGILENPNEDKEKGKNIFDYLANSKLMKNSSVSVKSFLSGIGGAVSAPELFVITALDKASNAMIESLYKSKVFGDETLGERFNRNLKEITDKISSHIYLKIINPISKALFDKKDGIVTKFKKRLEPVKGKAKDTFGKIKDVFMKNIGEKYFGITGNDKVSLTSLITKNLVPKMGNIGMGAGIGTLVSLATPFGLFGSVLLGSALGLTSSFDVVKDKLFGKLGDDGKRLGGLLPPQITDQFKGAKGAFGKGAGIGALASFLTPFGIAGTALMGGVLGMVTNMSSVKDILFGKMGANGERDDSSALIKKEWTDKFKKFSGKVNLSKAMKIGFFGSLFLPGGTIGGSIAALTYAIGSQSSKIQQYLFGDINPTTNKRQGGLFGKLKLAFKYNVMDPLTLGVKELFSKGKYFIKKNVIIPFLDVLDPLKKQLKEFGQKMKERFDSVFNWFKGIFSGIFKKLFGNKKDKDGNEKQGLFSKILGGTARFGARTAGKLITLPVRMLVGKADKSKLSEDELKLNDEKTEARNKKADDQRIKEQAKIDEARKKSKERKGILDDAGYSEESVNRILTLNDAEKGFANITEVNGKIVQNTSKIQEVGESLKDTGSEILSVIKETSKDVKTLAKEIGGNIADDLKRSSRESVAKSITNARNKKKQTSMFSSNKILGDSIEDENLMNSLGFSGVDDGSDYFSHASGLDNVPSDGYKAKLHKGEMILPGDQANILRDTLGINQEDVSGVIGPKNSNNKIVNNLSSLIGKTSIKLLTNINENVNKIYGILATNGNEKTGGTGLKQSDIKHFRNKLDQIYSNIDGQLVNVGYNVEYIRNILIDNFGEPTQKPSGIKGGIHKLKTFWSKITDFLKKPFGWLGEKFTAIKEKVTGFFGGIKNFFTKIKEKVTGFFKNMIALPKKILGIAVDFTKKVGTVIKNSIVNIGKIAGSAIKEVYGAGKKLVSDVFDMGKSLFKALPSIISTLGEAAKQAAISIGGFVSQVTKGLGSAFGQLAKTTAKLIDGTVTLATDLIPKIVQGIGAIVKPIWGFVKKGFKGIGNIFKGTVNTLGNAFTKNVNIKKINDNRLYKRLDKIISLLGGTPDVSDYFQEKAKKGIGTVFGNIKDKAKEGKKNVKSNFKQMKDSVKDQFNNTKDLTKAAFAQGMSEISNTLSEGKENTKGFFSGILSNFKGNIKKTSENLKSNLFSNLFGVKVAGMKVKSDGKKMKDTTIEKVSEVGERSKKIVKGAKGGISNAFANMKEDLSNIKNTDYDKNKGLLGRLRNTIDTAKEGLAEYKKAKEMSSTSGKIKNAFGMFKDKVSQVSIFNKKEKNQEDEKYKKKKRKWEIPALKGQCTIGKVTSTLFSKKGLFGLIAVVGLALLPLAIQKISEIKSKGGLFAWIFDKTKTFITDTLPKFVSFIGDGISKGLGWLAEHAGDIATWMCDGITKFIKWCDENKILEKICTAVGTFAETLLKKFFPFLDDGKDDSPSQEMEKLQTAYDQGKISESDYYYRKNYLNNKMNEEKIAESSNDGNTDSTTVDTATEVNLHGSDAYYYSQHKDDDDTDNPNVVSKDQIAKMEEENNDLMRAKERVSVAEWLGSGLGYLGGKANEVFGYDQDWDTQDYTDAGRDLFSQDIDQGASDYNILHNVGAYVVGNYDQRETAKESMSRNWNMFKDATVGRVANAGDWIGDKWSGIKQYANDSWAEERAKVAANQEQIKQGFSDAGDWIGDKWSGIKQGFSDAGDWIGDKASGIGDWLSGIGTSIKDSFSNGISNGIDAVKSWWKDKISDPISNWWDNTVVKTFDSVKQWFNDNIITPVKNFFGWINDSVITPIKDFFGWVKKEVVEKIKDFFSWIDENVLQPINGFFTWVNDNVIEKLENIFGGAVDKVKSGAKSAWNWITGGSDDDSGDDSSDSGDSSDGSSDSDDAGSGFGNMNHRNAGAGNIGGDDHQNGAVYFSQNDQRWSQKNYGTASIGASGCGPTAMAMLLSSTTGKGVTPDETASWSVSHGFRIPGEGTAFGFFPAIGKEYGVNMTATEDYDGALMNALHSGYPAILSGKGNIPFTKNGHLLFAVGANGSNVIINDPVSKDRSKQYSISSLKSGLMQAWISDKKLDGSAAAGTVASDSTSSSGDSSSSSGSDSNPFATALGKLGSLTSGLLFSTISGKEFDQAQIDNILNPKSSSSSSSSSSGGDVSAANVSGSDVEKNVWDYFTGAGYSKAATAGILGNMYQESGVDPKCIQGNGAGPAAGIVQWENYNTKSGRWKEMSDYAASKGKDWTDLGSQLEFINKELQNLGSFWNPSPSSAAYGNFTKAGAQPTTFANWKASTDVDAATRQFEAAFERAGIPAMNNRLSRAKGYYNKFAGAGNGFGENKIKIRAFPINDNAGAGNGEIDKKITKNTNKVLSNRYKQTQDFILNAYASASDDVSNYISANKVGQENNYSDQQIQVIINLLSKIVDNTAETAENTANIAENTVNIIQNNNLNNNSNNKTDSNKSDLGTNTLGKISESNGGKTINDAYQKAILLAQGIVE